MKKIFIIAGEPSGDLLGARLIAALRAQMGPDLQVSGIGGERMTGQGLQSLFPMSELTLFGVAEVVPKIPLVLRRIRETVAAIRAAKPDLVITIDSPDFCFRVTRRLAGAGLRCVHYVAPTVWAWRPGRAKAIQPLYQHLLALFPFEPPYFERVGLPCTFVGHPLVEAGIETASGQRFRQAHRLAESEELLVVLPGSRSSELARLLPVFSAVVAQLAQQRPGLRIVVPTLPHLLERLQQATASWLVPPIFVTNDTDKYDALKAGTVGLAASGTVALELALAGLPSVIAYKIHPLTYYLYRRFIRVRYVNLVNIMAGQLVVPEYLQNDCTADRITDGVSSLLNSQERREQQKSYLERVSQQLRPNSDQTPSQAAAQCITKLLETI